MYYKIGVACVLYENIDEILPNKLHGPTHYKIGVTCVYHGHVFYTLYYVITWQSNPSISQFNSLCNEFMSVWSMFVYNTQIDIELFTTVS